MALLDFNDICRICLQTAVPNGPFLIPITSKHDDETSLLDLMNIFLNPLKFHPDDKLPDKICTNCVDSLKVAHEMRKMAFASNETLLEQLQKTLQQRFLAKDIENIGPVDLCTGDCTRCAPANCDLLPPSTEATPSVKSETCRFCGSNRDKCSLCSLDGESGDSLNLEEPLPAAIVTEDSTLDSTSGQQLKCPKCSKEYNNPKTLRKHVLSHNPVKPFKCPKCKWSFQSEHELETHNAVNHTPEGDRNECIYCFKKFKEKRLLRQHMISHKSTKKFICKICKKGFNLQHHLRNHEKIHGREANHECPECLRKFLTKDRLIFHRRHHKSEANKMEEKIGQIWLICNQGSPGSEGSTDELIERVKLELKMEK